MQPEQTPTLTFLGAPSPALDWIVAELEAVAVHWEQFGNGAEAAASVRDALKIVLGGGVICTVPQHTKKTCEERRGAV